MGRTASRKSIEPVVWFDEEETNFNKNSRHLRRAKRHKEKATFRNLVKGAIDPYEIEYEDLDDLMRIKK